MLDVLNEQLIAATARSPIAFDHDCREGICGMCGLMINGEAHGPRGDHHLPAAHALASTTATTIDDRAVAGRARSRSSRTSSSTAAPSTGSSRPAATSRVTDRLGARGARRRRCPSTTPTAPSTRPTCIGCGACVAACPNASAMLFIGAKVTHLGLLPQGQPERDDRVVNMVAQHDARGLRRLHQHRRVHRRLPQGDPARRDRQPQPRLPARHHRREAPAHRLRAGSTCMRMRPGAVTTL